MDVYQGEQNGVRPNSLSIEVVEGGMGGTCDTKQPPVEAGMGRKRLERAKDVRQEDYRVAVVWQQVEHQEWGGGPLVLAKG